MCFACWQGASPGRIQERGHPFHSFSPPSRRHLKQKRAWRSRKQGISVCGHARSGDQISVFLRSTRHKATQTNPTTHPYYHTLLTAIELSFLIMQVGHDHCEFFLARSLARALPGAGAADSAFFSSVFA